MAYPSVRIDPMPEASTPGASHVSTAVEALMLPEFAAA